MNKSSVTKYHYYDASSQGLWNSSTPSTEYPPTFSTTFSWEIIDQDVVNNTSTIKWELRASPYKNFQHVDDIYVNEADDINIYAFWYRPDSVRLFRLPRAK